jgi:hypothetical protein
MTLTKLHKYSFALALFLFGVGMVGWWGVNQAAYQNEQGSVLAATTTAGSAINQKAAPKTLEERVLSLEKRVAALEKKTGGVGTTSGKSALKEQTVFLGSGESSSTNWTDIEKATVELNATNYPGVKQVFFEATLSIVGGEASARLKNKTTGGIIYLSEVKHNSSTPTVKLSAPFWLSGGSNEYVVQVRSSSNEKVFLESARLRLLYE